MEDVHNAYEKDEEQRLSQFHLLAERGDMEAVRSLLMLSANVDVLDTMHNTPLHIATLNGHIDVVNLLLSKNANVNFRNALGQTSLHLAAEIGHLAIAQLLLDRNADVHAPDQSNKTPIDIAAMRGHNELIQLLISSSEFPLIWSSPLHIAATCGNTKDVQQRLLNYDENLDSTNLDGDTPLHLASKYGHFKTVEVLLRNDADVNIRNASCKTSLHIAAELGNAELVKAMIDHEGKVNVVDRNGDYALNHAARNGHFEVVGVLLRTNADINFRNVYGKTPLHIAAEMGYTEIVKALIDHHFEVNAEDRNYNNALHHATSNNHFEVVEALLRNKADANMHNASGKTPLHIAAELGYAEITKAMIDHEGEVNAVDRNGDTALHLAACNGHSAVVNVLLNQTAKMDVQIHSQLAVNQDPVDKLELSQHPIENKADVGYISLLITAESANAETADIQSSHSSTFNGVFKGQATPPTQAVENGSVKNLMFNDANVNACNNAKMTPLHLACQNGHTSIVEILLDNHATVDVMKQSEKTPFYLAAKNGHAAVSALLIRRGVCDFVELPFEYERKDIQTPLLVAVEKGHTEVVEVILKHGSRISEKLTKDGKKPQENTKKGVMPVELLKSDGRRVCAEIVWTEINTPLEIKRNLFGEVPLVLIALSNDPKMVQLMRDVDQRMYSETDIAEIFRSMIDRIQLKYFTDEALSNAIKYRMNFRVLAQFLINSSKFNVNHQDYELDTFLHDVIRQRNKSSSYGCLAEESNRINLQIQIINDVMQLLLVKGADFNLKNSFGETPLMIASQYGCDQAIQTLFCWEHKSGIKLDLDARDSYGATALIKAARGSHVSAMRLLLNHKASVNLYDYYGFTALHAAIYAPDRNWFDFHFFCKCLLQGKFDGVNCSENNSRYKPTWRKETVDLYTVIDRLQSYLEYNTQATRFREEIVKLLLDNDETNVNAMDVGGNTPLDLAVKSSKRINSGTFETLKNRGAICNLLEPEDEAPMEQARVDESGRYPLHRLVLCQILDLFVFEDVGLTEEELDQKRFDLMVEGILLGLENFNHVATATDRKGRTPLHYAVMTPSYHSDQELDLVRVLLHIGSNVNAADMYGKTPLHYAERSDRYELLVKYGADKYTRDKHGHTPKELDQLRHSTFSNAFDARHLIGKEPLYAPMDIAQVLRTHYVTELTKQKLFETIRIYSQSPRPQVSSENAIWKIWTEKEPIRLNKRLSHLKLLIHQFIERLADGIKEKDWRFECQPILVGSANEETKVTISGDFDFNFKLIKFSQFCDPFPHPLGPKGYFQLRRKPNEDRKSRTDEKFDSFFNLDKCLLTNEVNYRFKIILKEVLSDLAFSQDDHHFEWNLKDKYKSKYKSLNGLCMTIELKMIHPIQDRHCGFLFVDISIDVVACVCVEGWWPEDPLPFGISPSVKGNGSTFVFNQPRFDPSKPRVADFVYSETFARISFAPLESRIIKESSTLIKAAYIVCKMILYFNNGTTYQLKTCLLFCMEALNARNESETRKEDELTPQKLTFWVERIMFCFMEFSRHNVYPCYFMPSFKQQTVEMRRYINVGFTKDTRKKELGITLRYSEVYDIYLDLCPDDTAVDIPIVPIEIKRPTTEESFNENHDSNWEQFDREEFIRKLSSHGNESILMNSSPSNSHGEFSSWSRCWAALCCNRK